MSSRLLPPESAPRYLARDRPRTVTTGHRASWSTCAATLPTKRRPRPERPCVPITMTSARSRFARRAIVGPGVPAMSAPLARTPVREAVATSRASFRSASRRACTSSSTQLGGSGPWTNGDGGVRTWSTSSRAPCARARATASTRARADACEKSVAKRIRRKGPEAIAGRGSAERRQVGGEGLGLRLAHLDLRHMSGRTLSARVAQPRLQIGALALCADLAQVRSDRRARLAHRVTAIAALLLVELGALLRRARRILGFGL